MRIGIAAAGLLLATSAQAHTFGQLYTLPVPFALYAWAASAALLLSFLAAAWLIAAPDGGPALTRRLQDPSRLPVLGRLPLPALLRTASVALLLLTIATGLFGPSDPYLNVGMTAFWIGFVLAYAYLAAVVGNVHDWLSPWRVLCDWLAGPAGWPGKLRYPPGAGRWPALIGYLLFIAFELFGHGGPATLAWLLIGYTATTLAGAWLFGTRAWLGQGEFFAVFLSLTARLAPLAWVASAHPRGWPRLRLRAPVAGLAGTPASDLSEVLFVLFMLSSTAFDGLHMTQTWDRFYWESLYGLMQPWLGSNIVTAYPTLKMLHGLWEGLALLISPLVYLGLYLLCLALARRLASTPLSLRDLALRFAPSLLPIALVYHLSHYYTLLFSQGVQLGWLVSDPFGLGWNLFGSDRPPVTGMLPDMGTIWHTQVGLILAGHITSVVVAHREALQCFGNRRAAALSQLPLLALMVAFTVFGLWILAQPLSSGM